MSVWFPTMLKTRITDITVEELTSRGVRALLLDVDNTLTRHHSQQLDDDVAAWLQGMKAAGIALMLVSNSREKRVAPFADRIGLAFVHTACKPIPVGFWRAIKALKVPKTACMAVGDQTFTDVLGAKLAGIAVTQLLPIEPESGRSFRVRRRLEKRVLARYAAAQKEKER